MTGNIKRILVYTHNSIGLGHAFRTLAVITAIKKWRPDINFLVMSSTSIPQIFFNEGIEVVKLPSIKLDIDRAGEPMIPRYLNDLDVESIFEFRQRIILETFDFFKPDALIVEHNMTGQMSEVIPLLMKKYIRQGGPADFALAHICRGIMRWVPLLRIPYQNPRHRSESINLGRLYDFMYVLEDREVIDINKAFLGNDSELEPKIRYLGKITNKGYDELAPREEVLRRFALPDKKIVLISLGRNKCVPDLSIKLLELMAEAGVKESHQVVFILDAYLGDSRAELIRNHPSGKGVRFLNFVPDLVDLVNQSEMVISRAGYNTVNEILLTGAKALLIPESHGSAEQEQRVRSVPNENMLVYAEEQVFANGSESTILNLMNSDCTRAPITIDKYKIGKFIIEELEDWASRKKRPPL
jgi:predicted glycosyltransferase